MQLQINSRLSNRTRSRHASRFWTSEAVRETLLHSVWWKQKWTTARTRFGRSNTIKEGVIRLHTGTCKAAAAPGRALKSTIITTVCPTKYLRQYNQCLSAQTFKKKRLKCKKNNIYQLYVQGKFCQVSFSVINTNVL